MPSRQRSLLVAGVALVAALVGLGRFLLGGGGFESSTPALTAVGVGVALVAVVVTALRAR